MNDELKAKRLTKRLSASSSDEVASALYELEHMGRRRPAIPVPMPRAEVFEVFGDRPPEAVVSSLVTILLEYPVFAPAVDREDRVAEALRAALPFGAGQPAYDIARFVRASDNPPDAAAELMRLLLDADVEDATGLDAMAQIIDVLLDVESLREVMISELERWVFRGRYSKVIRDLGRALTDAERERLRRTGT